LAATNATAVVLNVQPLMLEGIGRPFYKHGNVNQWKFAAAESASLNWSVKLYIWIRARLPAYGWHHAHSYLPVSGAAPRMIRFVFGV